MKEHSWKAEELALEDVRDHPRFQMRVYGLSDAHVRVLERAYEAGGDVEAIKVARIGKALYVVDGFHRVEAARRANRPRIAAKVARMSLEEAREFARLANTKHGKSLSRADKAEVLRDYCAAERHIGPLGTTKPSRTIAAELNHIYSHETIRTRLRSMGVELDEEQEFPGGYKPMYPQPDEEQLAAERAEEASLLLHRFSSLFFTLEVETQQELLVAARELMERLERGERPELGLGSVGRGVLDI
jgi:hypothetical protein